MIPEWAFKIPLNLVFCSAKDFDLDPHLVAAIVNQESRGMTYAARYEPLFRYLEKPADHAKQQGISVETEEMLQKTSFGLLQIMGGTARFIGYSGALPALFKPDTNLYWGCRYLKRLKGQYPDIKDMVAAYNAGSPRKDSTGAYVNQSYVDSVLRFYNELKSS